MHVEAGEWVEDSQDRPQRIEPDPLDCTRGEFCAMTPGEQRNLVYMRAIRLAGHWRVEHEISRRVKVPGLYFPIGEYGRRVVRIDPRFGGFRLRIQEAWDGPVVDVCDEQCATLQDVQHVMHRYTGTFVPYMVRPEALGIQA